MKIVILDGYTLNPGDLSWEKFSAFGDVTVYERTPADKSLERIGDAPIIITNKTPITMDILDKAPHIQYIGVLATGYNVVDTKAARERNITVTNIPSYGTASVAQFVFALLLEMCHHVTAHGQSVKNGVWTSCSDFCFWNFPLIELAGKTMGVIGYGRIGQAVSKIANAFGMSVLAFDRCQNAASNGKDIRYADLDEVLSKSDIISLHCPLSEDTKELINKVSISKMKDGVMLINTSRGQLIHENDVAEALHSGKIAGFAADVLSSEPPEAENPLLQSQNCLITPHIAWAPKEARARLMNIAADNLRAYINGNPIHVVNG